MRPERYQIALITLGLIIAALLGRFLYKEIFPEYRIYQNDYIALEEFRSTYTGESPPAFSGGVKQIVFEREDKGPARIDRCTSCHVAEQLPHFSATKIAYDVNGNMIRSVDGTPVQVPNEEYIWAKLDKKIADLTDEKVNAHLTQEGDWSKLKARAAEAKKLADLKVAKVGEHVYDVTKVLSAHPLIGKETRPFEFHNIDDYGCTSCHSGNGRGLTTEKAHGPVYDGEYEIEYEGPAPEFTENDPKNDPDFARVFNNKPSDVLLFQTTPILVNSLIQASCIQCHEQSATALQGLADTAGSLVSQRNKDINAMKLAYANEKEALLALIKLKQSILSKGYDQVLKNLEKALEDPALIPKEHEQLAARLKYLKEQKGKEAALADIHRRIVSMLGSDTLEANLEKALEDKNGSSDVIAPFLNEHYTDEDATGTLFVKWEAGNLEEAFLNHIEDTRQSFAKAAADQNTIAAMASDIDALTKNFHRGQQLYLSQACYACHKIAGTARGGVGPELTRAGENYPWYLKESIVWPQADLRTSTMPNFMLDHIELEDLMTYLLAQKGPTKTVSDSEYKIAIQEWESGRKMSWEKPISPSEVHDLRFAMTVFATQGCAACHRLEGYQSNVGYRAEKEEHDFESVYRESEWFQSLFPEEILGSALVEAVDKHADEIDKRIVDDVRKDALLEEIEKKYPESIESFYSNFRFAARAKNDLYKQIEMKAEDPVQKQAAQDQLKAWQHRVHRVLMMYVQEYGLGRLIGPRPNWSGVYRSDEWLMEHFHNPAGHVPHSIMPILPFDDSKFYALTYMLDELGRRNRDRVHAIWEHNGFNPAQAFQIHCSQCHGNYLQGNGPVSTWIYPIPKNLRNAEFLRNLTKENAIQSITHGVKGTPMPPWGETPHEKQGYDGIPILSSEEITKLVNWLYSSVPGATVIKGVQDVPKWFYTPKDVLEELKREGGQLKSGTPSQEHETSESPSKTSSVLGLDHPDLQSLPTGDNYYAALEPKVNVYNDDQVRTIFDVVPNPVPGGDKNAYYIKKEYYTQENIESGKRFFELNCAVCHGNEADGSGIRASIMMDAKPRMLTNLDWIKMRDDLRLLRSIKYGVPGTAMTPWGDLTSSLQRMQLVIFIRSLSQEKDRREALAEMLYKVFDKTDQQIEKARFAEYPTLESIENTYSKTVEKQKLANRNVQAGKQSIQAALTLYQQQLEEGNLLKQHQKIDRSLSEIKKLMTQEREIYQNIGLDMLSSNVDESIWEKYLNILSLTAQPFDFAEGKLSLKESGPSNPKVTELVNQIVNLLDANIASEKKEKIIVEGKLPSKDKEALLHNITADIEKNGKVKAKLLSGLEEISRLRNQQRKVITEYQNEKNALQEQSK